MSVVAVVGLGYGMELVLEREQVKPPSARIASCC
jgi:hypothetical protein